MKYITKNRELLDGSGDIEYTIYDENTEIKIIAKPDHVRKLGFEFTNALHWYAMRICETS